MSALKDISVLCLPICHSYTSSRCITCFLPPYLSALPPVPPIFGCAFPFLVCIIVYPCPCHMHLIIIICRMMSKRRKKLKSRCRKGIPDGVRCLAWPKLMGVQQLR